MFTGKSLDQVYGKNHDELLKLKGENKDLKKQIEATKLLNEKLSEKVEHLEEIISKEASANTFYFNYPPKGETVKDSPGKPQTDSEAAKVKKVYEEQMDLQKKQYENQLKELR